MEAVGARLDTAEAKAIITASVKVVLEVFSQAASRLCPGPEGVDFIKGDGDLPLRPRVVKCDGECRVSVPACTTTFLRKVKERRTAAVAQHQPHPLVIDSCSKTAGRNHDCRLSFSPSMVRGGLVIFGERAVENSRLEHCLGMQFLLEAPTIIDLANIDHDALLLRQVFVVVDNQSHKGVVLGGLRGAAVDEIGNIGSRSVGTQDSRVTGREAEELLL